MAYKDFQQPEIIEIDENIRLRKYDGNYKQAVAWYQDEFVYKNSEGISDSSKIPDEKYVRKMYEYLSENGELYFIELMKNGTFIPIGDVTLKEENPCIAIGVAQYRGIGIGKKAMRAIIERAKKLGIQKFYGSSIYDYNIISQKMHESLGFKCVEARDGIKVYELNL